MMNLVYSQYLFDDFGEHLCFAQIVVVYLLNINRLESLIRKHGWSNTYFSSQFGKSRSWISDMKHGVGLPDENTLQAIADKLDTTVDYLTDKTDKKEKPPDCSGGHRNAYSVLPPFMM